MRIRYERITAPTDLPLSDLEARLHLRNPENTEDSELLSFIQSAVVTVEHKLGRALVAQTWEAYLDRFPIYCDPQWIDLWPLPIRSITSINYVDPTGVTWPWSSSDYVLTSGGLVGRISLVHGASWPLIRSYGEAITIRYVAGYPNVDAIPENILHWIKLFVETADKQRGLGSDKPFVMSPFADGLLDGSRTGLGV